MIIYPQSLILAAAATPTPLDYPRIGWSSYLEGLSIGSIVASSETVLAPKDAPLRADTSEYWLPTSLPATWQADFGQARTIDYVGIAAHSLGTNRASVKVQLDSSNLVPDPNVSLPAVAANYASTPDSAIIDIVGDLDIRWRVIAGDYTPAANDTIAAKWNPTGNQRSWSFDIETTGKLILQTSPNGTTVRTHTSSIATGLTDATSKYLRATRSASTGVVKFWMSDDNITYTQLGADVAGTIEGIFNSTAPLEVGSNAVGTLQLFAGAVLYGELRNSIGGSVVAKFDPSEGLDGATSWISGTGETWTVNTSGGSPARLNNNILVFPYLPADDSPLMLLFTARTGRYLKITVSGVYSVPKIACIYAGVALALEMQVVDSFTPVNLANETVRKTFLSRGGQFLGQSVRRNGVGAPISFRFLSTAWVRANFMPFAKSIGKPYFIAWNPLYYPGDIGFVWHEEDIHPMYSGMRDLMEVGWKVHGIGVP